MPRKKDNTLGSSYGPMEGVTAASKGSSRLTGGSIHQHGLSAPSGPKREKPKTYSASEGVSILAEKFFGAKKEAPKPKKGKRKPAPKKRR